MHWISSALSVISAGHFFVEAPQVLGSDALGQSFGQLTRSIENKSSLFFVILAAVNYF